MGSSQRRRTLKHFKTIMNEIKLSWYDPDKRKDIPKKLGILNNSLNSFINKKIDEINSLSRKL